MKRPPLCFVAVCLTPGQKAVCQEMGIPVAGPYATCIGDITPGCVTDYGVHCFNSATLAVLQRLGVARATLHPELNLAQIRDMRKPIDTEAIIYGRLPLMRLGTPLSPGVRTLTDRTGANFIVIKNNEFAMLYNAVPLFTADKLRDISDAGLTHGRLFFTAETSGETRRVIEAYQRRVPLGIPYTRGRFFAKKLD